MRKTLLPFLLMISFCSVYSQTDSTEINLQKYKELHEQGLINDLEYDLLKKKELDITEVGANEDEIDLSELKRKYKPQMVSGSLELASGIVLAGFGFYNATRPDEVIVDSKTGKISVNDFKTPTRMLLASSVPFVVLGILSLVKGTKNRSNYYKRVSASPTGVSFKF